MNRAAKTRILVVDDHRMMREGLRGLLEQDPSIEVVGEAGDGLEAVGAVASLRPDVVVMDVVMRGMNGIEATRQIRSTSPETIVIALSSHSDPRYVRAILEAGAAGYVLKANAYDQLMQSISAAQKGHKYLSAEITADLIDGTLRRVSPESAYELLGPREREVLQLLAEGSTSAEIARRLSLATTTVETHRRNIMRKLSIHSVAELTKYAVREGLTSLEPPQA